MSTQALAIDASRTIVDGGVIYHRPGDSGSIVPLRTRYDNFIGGQWRAPSTGRYGEDIAPATGQPFAEYARSGPDDVDAAVAERAAVLNAIADRLEQNLESIAVMESRENGKPVRETLHADIPLALDHFRYFASAIRAQEGTIAPLSRDLVSYHFFEPIGVVAQIIPWNFPLLMAAWKLAPAIAAGNTVVLKPASATPVSVLYVLQLIEDLLPAGVVNVVNGAGSTLGQALVEHPGVAKVAFTGSTETGRQIMQYAVKNIIPSTMELGGKSPNIYFDDVSREHDAFYRKALEGMSLFAFNKGEVCSCPSRAFLQRGLIRDGFLDAAVERISRIRVGDPLDTRTEMGPQNSAEQVDKIAGYLALGPMEGCEVLAGGGLADLGGDLSGGYFVEPTVFRGRNEMRVFQEEIFGPVLAVAAFDEYDEAIHLANATIYGLGSGVWSRDADLTFAASRDIHAGRVWVNTYHQYPAGAAFGGYKQSGYSRETDQQTLRNYQQVKNVLVNHQPLGLFV
ncbi:aldehyde dehydrogenase [Leifsonia xyli subsp. xyli]|uniref:Aldehyde dehydrogenase n=2 Tax=Leifsonia xyli subsp. xyli TaxID=59736 RepID=Q6ACG6_LEIXX|nr:aldehyde dehydrogenase family protein [Leifsonia xyli]AAT89927.1 aldehyde dehydrogenase [Leifsonia xyli subsp. xyli str. CTCB07]ODA90098.1 aldehyde dehydrogenase [Leifsonia xyli subsp. xyli]